MKFNDYVLSTLDLKNARLSEDYYYNSVVFCVIDAVFSINSRYKSTQNTVLRYCNYNELLPYRSYGSTSSDIQNEHKIEDFLNITEGMSFESIANDIFGNRQRTSPSNGILKAQAVCEFANTLYKNGINDYSTFYKLFDGGQIESEIKRIKGQSSGLTLTYLYMLAGHDDYIKADRHILNFIKSGTGRQVSKEEAEWMVTESVAQLKEKFPDVTCRLLDYTIWRYMSSK